MKTQTPLCRWLCTGITLSAAILVGSPTVAQVFEFTNITDLPQGPGQSAFPSINDPCPRPTRGSFGRAGSRHSNQTGRGRPPCL
jgi:hypothetical protein